MAEQDDAKVIELHPSTLTDGETSAEVWIDRYARLHGIEYHYKTHSVRQDGEAIDPALFIAQMRLMTHRLDLGGIKKMLPDGFLVWRREQARAFIRKLRHNLEFKSINSDPLSDWVEASTGRRDPIDIAITRHFIWQVKRKLFGLPVEHHLMMVLFGTSGAGKSVAVHKLLAPIMDVTSLRDLTIFNDQFARRAFARNYVIFFDELGRSQDADINALKNIITSPTVDWRGIGSESVHSAPQNSTFIGCSNLPVRERIHDPTSSRRFFQLDCASKLDWDKINSIGYLALWKSVDENSPCPILSCINEVRAIQQRDIQHQDLIEHWLSTTCEPHPFDPSSPGTDDLYGAFSSWCQSQCRFDFEGIQTFARGLQMRINSLKWEASSKRSNRGTIWSIRLKPAPAEPERRVIGLGAAVDSEAVSVPADTNENSEEK